MGKRTIAQAARNIVARQNVKISIQEFQAFVNERAQESVKATENKEVQANSAPEKK